MIGANGDLIGKVGQIYLDDGTGQPEWATVNTGLFGTSESFVPLAQASTDGGSLQVPYDQDKVKGAPQVQSDGHLSPQVESKLYRYYGLQDPSGGTQTVQQTGTVDTDTTREVHTDDAMTRSAEQLKVSEAAGAAGRAGP